MAVARWHGGMVSDMLVHTAWWVGGVHTLWHMYWHWQQKEAERMAKFKADMGL